jgi:S-adenosylmethionine hydrolase
VIKRIAPDAEVIDITHGIAPHNVLQGALVLASTLPFMPEGIHLAVVDPGVGGHRRAVALRGSDGRLYVGPDNGLLAYAADKFGGVEEAVELANPAFRLDPVAHTFHGRDVFAPVAAALASGAEPDDLGVPITDPVTLPGARVVREGGRVRGAVVHVDRFGNLITSLSRRDLGGDPRPGFRLHLAGREVRGFHHFYSEAAGGEPFATWGSAGLLEIAVDHGSAAALLNAGRGAEVVVELGQTDLRPEP